MISGRCMKKRNGCGKKSRAVITALAMLMLLSAGCESAAGDAAKAEQVTGREALQTEKPAGIQADIVKSSALSEETAAPAEKPTPLSEAASSGKPTEPETLGNPRSSFGIGSAAFLKGRNILVSLFVSTPESAWTEEEQQEALEKLKTAADYIETQAKAYDTDVEVIFDWNSQFKLKAEAYTDFPINEDTDFMDRLDEEIARWFNEKISCEELLEEYEAEGIAICVFVNNPGISYAIVYDGTDNVKESIILFTGDYYRLGQEETAAVYAHEILHVFGAHDLYEDAEFTKEVTDYVADVYPDEIMFSVSGSSAGIISQNLSPITAYHLGWIDYTGEIDLFPQLNRY